MAERWLLVDAYPFGLDLVYVHMDLNTKVRSLFSVLPPFLIQGIDPLYGTVFPIPQILCSIL